MSTVQIPIIFTLYSVIVTLLVQLQTHTLLILAVGKLIVVLCLINVAKSLSVPTYTHHILYTTTETQ
jgi:hypothetical protein